MAVHILGIWITKINRNLVTLDIYIKENYHIKLITIIEKILIKRKWSNTPDPQSELNWNDLFSWKNWNVYQSSLIYTNAHLSLNSRSSEKILAAGMFDVQVSIQEVI